MRQKLLIGSIILTALSVGCAAFRAQHSSEMYDLSASAAPASVVADPDATFARVQSEILTPRCAVPDCHVANAEDGPPEGLVLAAGQSYDMIVGVRANQRELLRIAPGNPDDSYLVRKVTPGAEISWHPMPLGAPSLEPAKIELLRSWVSAGAPR